MCKGKGYVKNKIEFLVRVYRILALHLLTAHGRICEFLLAKGSLHIVHIVQDKRQRTNFIDLKKTSKDILVTIRYRQFIGSQSTRDLLL